LDDEEAMAQESLKLELQKQVPGRALCIGKTGSLYLSRGYCIFRSDDGGETWNLDCRIPAHGWKPFAARFALVARLLRFNVQALQVLPNGNRVAVAHGGIYCAYGGEVEMRRTWQVKRGSRPINLSADGNRVLFGEYGGREMDALRVLVYCSEDGGQNFEPVYEFPQGDIHHIHNVVVDGFQNRYWVLAGDHGRAPGIASLSRDFRHLDWVESGNQMVRAVSVLIRPDCLIYGSDSELETNHIVRLDKKTGQIERILPIDGSSLYAADFGAMGLISTCVEPSAINQGRCASIYGSTDDSSWSPLFSAPKDGWEKNLFQFGTLVLPYVLSHTTVRGMFSGQAIVGYHNRTEIVSL
jgi:hypothetical protein